MLVSADASTQVNSGTSVSFIPLASKSLAKITPTPLATAAPVNTPVVISTPLSTPVAILEDFESTESQWGVFRDDTGSGSVTRTDLQSAEGNYSALITTSNSGSKAQVRVNFSDAASNHIWEERPGTWHWQQASVYLPASTVANLGSGEYLTLAGLWSTDGSTGWWLRVRQDGELYVVGHRDWDNQPVEFRVYGKFPVDRWVNLELGLHSQSGPGVKRAFAFLIDGEFYGWYHQGRMKDETYDRAAVGILDTNSSSDLRIFVDQWRSPSEGEFPGGPDNRPTNNLQTQDYRSQSGVQWQIDWTTWENNLKLDAKSGLYSAGSRVQSGRNLDRMPELQSGWVEIEIDWPQGTPTKDPSGYFGPMVGFRKEINREENLEVIPIGQGGGKVNLAVEAWVNSGPVILAEWPMPQASIGGTSIPEPGDIIRARWEQINATDLNIRASFYDASAGKWYPDIINLTQNITNIGGVNLADGYHLASSITIDTPVYSIRYFRVGTLDSYP